MGVHRCEKHGCLLEADEPGAACRLCKTEAELESWRSNDRKTTIAFLAGLQSEADLDSLLAEVAAMRGQDLITCAFCQRDLPEAELAGVLELHGFTEPSRDRVCTRDPICSDCVAYFRRELTGEDRHRLTDQFRQAWASPIIERDEEDPGQPEPVPLACGPSPTNRYFCAAHGDPRFPQAPCSYYPPQPRFAAGAQPFCRCGITLDDDGNGGIPHMGPCRPADLTPPEEDCRPPEVQERMASSKERQARSKFTG